MEARRNGVHKAELTWELLKMRAPLNLVVCQSEMSMDCSRWSKSLCEEVAALALRSE